MINKHKVPDITNIPKLLNLDRYSLSAIQPGVGFASPNATPPTRAANYNLQEKQIY